MFSTKCKKHITDTGMTRWEHFKFAFKFLVELKKAECAIAVHMFLPRYYENYASDKIKTLAHKMEKHK